MFIEMLYFSGVLFYIEVNHSHVCFYLDTKTDLTDSKKLDTLTVASSYREKSSICIV